jgi:peptidoglycan hydrolase-like protein with peptidoglycan-binding domain
LGTLRPPDRQVWAHRDIKTTHCPGTHLYDRLELIRFLEEEDENMMDKATWKKVQTGLQSLDPPLYANRPIDGKPGSNTNRAVRAFEGRIGFTPRGVMGSFDDSSSGMWPATREMLFASVFAPLKNHDHEVEISVGHAPLTAVRVGRVKG